MSKVITFSRVFPSHHPKKGQPTYFVEQILNQLHIDYRSSHYLEWLYQNNESISKNFLYQFWYSLENKILNKKIHTIRNHKKPLKVGDFINPKCWAGEPYNKTVEGFWQIKFAPDIEIKKTFDFEIKNNGIYINNECYYYEKEGVGQSGDDVIFLAKNDGLLVNDMFDWFQFPKPFSGQINSWNKNVEYN